ncbi:hypothetical protein EWI61_00365 [Methylolobus aquaticus]|nr:hypothetical protein EWI61_00365 [Methylolobus aquaticus]
MRTLIRLSLRALSLAALSMAAAALRAAEERSPITHGLMVGEVTQDTAVVWARSDRETTMHAWVRAVQSDTALHQQAPVIAAHDYTGKLAFRGLEPDTAYQYAVRFGGDSEPPRHDPVSGSFRTAPVTRARQPVRFLWGGDLAGQNVCRDAQEGFPIFPQLTRSRWDFFLAMGNMIYADSACEHRGKYGNVQIPGRESAARTLAEFWTAWKYTRLDRGLQDFLARTPYFPVWNDHEVVDDFGPLHDTSTARAGEAPEHLLPIGLTAFFDYNPLLWSQDRPFRLYRSVRWGQHAELFLLDTRQYRDANGAEDRPDRPKTLLGREQLTWLKHRLSNSDATWKFIISSVPLAVPTGSQGEKGRDGWASADLKTGFERELSDLTAFMRGEGLKNIVWLTSNTQFAQALRLHPFSPDSPFVMHEFTSGPLNASLLPNRTLDASLRPERLFFFGPDNPAKIKSFSEAKEWMNVGAVEIDENGTLTSRIMTATGRTAWTSEPLQPR